MTIGPNQEKKKSLLIKDREPRMTPVCSTLYWIYA